jgi:hypothetical protein
MISNTIKLTMIMLILALILGSCDENAVTPEIQPSGILTDYEGCKTFMTSSSLQTEFYINTEECIEYDYDGESVLILKHINAGFNCCPGKIDTTISVTENKIVIEDKEEEQGCFCQCLFDLRYEIVDLDPGEYTIAVSGPYIEDTDERLLFNLRLFGPSSGTFCVDRTHYPWGVDD